jgi:hypothetical protein
MREDAKLSMFGWVTAVAVGIVLGVAFVAAVLVGIHWYVYGAP